MDKPQFTPGPWSKYDCYDPSGKRLVSYDIGGPQAHFLNGVAVLASVFGNDANARLIAAAPELYEALDNLLNESADTSLTSAMMLNAGLSATFVKAVERGLAALAKARGEQ